MLITLAGPDGAGKSTQSKLLAEWYTKKGVEVTILDKWDILDSSIHPDCRFIKSTLDELRVCIAEMKGESRALFLFWSIFQSMIDKKDLHSNNHVYISDGYWIKHAASEVLYGNDESWIESVTAAFPKSDFTFYFDIAPNITSIRKINFTPYECGRNSEMKLQQFIEHQSGLKKLMDKWSKQGKWIEIDAGRNQSDVFLEICNHLNRESCNA